MRWINAAWFVHLIGFCRHAGDDVINKVPVSADNDGVGAGNSQFSRTGIQFIADENAPALAVLASSHHFQISA